MKIPFLILCIAVVYGTCRKYKSEESIDLAEKTQNHEKWNYANNPLEKFLPRQKRADVLSILPNPIDTILKLPPFNGLFGTVLSAIVNSMKFVTNALVKQDFCSKMQEFSITTIITNPIKSLETLTCHAIHFIGTKFYDLMGKTFDIFMKLFVKVVTCLVLPGMDMTLNSIKPYVPLQIEAFIDGFHAIYKLLKTFHMIPNDCIIKI